MDALSDNLIHRFNIGDVLKRTATRYPSRVVHDSGRDITYRELDGMANRVARRCCSALS